MPLSVRIKSSALRVKTSSPDLVRTRAGTRTSVVFAVKMEEGEAGGVAGEFPVWIVACADTETGAKASGTQRSVMAVRIFTSRRPRSVYRLVAISRETQTQADQVH